MLISFIILVANIGGQIMSIKLAINGFGRIGRLAFRRAYDEKDFEVVAINDLSSAANLAYLLKYDSAQGPWRVNDISAEEDPTGETKGFIVLRTKNGDQRIPVIGQKDPALLEWSKYGVDIVLECTGRFKGQADALVHVEKGGAKGVVISAPADKETRTFVYGVNHTELTADLKVISGASCTTNCLAPVLKVLEEKWGIRGGYMTTVHAYTNDQTSLDLVKEKDFRRGRACAQNIVPSSTGAAKAINLVLPTLKGRLQGGAIRVPVLDGSLVDLSLVLTRKVKDDDVNRINEAMLRASRGSLRGVLGYTDEPIVSRDIIGRTEGSIFDATQTRIFTTPEGEQLVKVVSWYDNEYSYTCQFVRLARHFAHVLGCDAE